MIIDVFIGGHFKLYGWYWDNAKECFFFCSAGGLVSFEDVDQFNHLCENSNIFLGLYKHSKLWSLSISACVKRPAVNPRQYIELFDGHSRNPDILKQTIVCIHDKQRWLFSDRSFFSNRQGRKKLVPITSQWVPGRWSLMKIFCFFNRCFQRSKGQKLLNMEHWDLSFLLVAGGTYGESRR